MTNQVATRKPPPDDELREFMLLVRRALKAMLDDDTPETRQRSLLKVVRYVENRYELKATE